MSAATIGPISSERTLLRKSDLEPCAAPSRSPHGQREGPDPCPPPPAHTLIREENNAANDAPAAIETNGNVIVMASLYTGTLEHSRHPLVFTNRTEARYVVAHGIPSAAVNVIVQ